MKKKILSVLLAVAMLCSLALPASAATEKNLKATYTGTKIVLEGETITPADATGKLVEPFAVDGTTYLPLRAVANALGLGVGWDQSTKTVKLTTGNPGPTTPGQDSQLLRLDFEAFGGTVCTLYFPSNWNKTTVYSSDPEAGTLTFFDKPNHANGEGHVFTLMLWPASRSYEYVPGCKFVQKIVYQGNTYNLLRRGPTDVQYDYQDPVKRKSYEDKYAQVPSIINGMVFSPAVQFTEPVTKSIKAVYTGTRITLNDIPITPKDANGKVVEPFAVDGTTYLPIRAVANALGLEVGWDQATKTVTLTLAALHRTVYVTPTGKRYHNNDSCNGGKYTRSTLEEALRRGLTPCDKCVLTKA